MTDGIDRIELADVVPDERPEAGDLFVLPEEGEHQPKEIADRLVHTLPDFTHLRVGEAAILFLMRTAPKVKAQRQILGQMALPKFGGVLSDLALWFCAKVCGEVPDFVMWLDSAWWAQAPASAREALVFHELCHAVHAKDKAGEERFDEEGRPVWDIRAHDLESFNEEVRRFGAWSPEIGAFIAAARAGGVA